MLVTQRRSQEIQSGPSNKSAALSPLRVVPYRNPGMVLPGHRAWLWASELAQWARVFAAWSKWITGAHLMEGENPFLQEHACSHTLNKQKRETKVSLCTPSDSFLLKSSPTSEQISNTWEEGTNGTGGRCAS